MRFKRFGRRHARVDRAVREAREEAGIFLPPETMMPVSRWVTPEGMVSTVATFTDPLGVTFGHAGEMYVSERIPLRVYRISVDGSKSLFASGFGPDHLYCLAMSPPGDLLVVRQHWSNSGLWKVSSSGVVQSFATVGGAPQGIAMDAEGNAYVVSNQPSVIHKVTPAGGVSLYAGRYDRDGSADGPVATATFRGPGGAMAFDAEGNLYVGDSENHTIRRISPSGMVTTVAGAVGATGRTDGPASQARFNAPGNIVIDSWGNLYLADSRNFTIRKGEFTGGLRITQQPVNRTVARGRAATFKVVATSFRPIEYQWLKDGQEVSGATNAILTILQTQMTDEGIYTVKVSNAVRALLSAPARLIVEDVDSAELELHTYAGLTITGTIGRSYRVEYEDALQPGIWKGIAVVQLTSSPQLWFDVDPAGHSRRFYRAILVP